MLRTSGEMVLSVSIASLQLPSKRPELDMIIVGEWPGLALLNLDYDSSIVQKRCLGQSTCDINTTTMIREIGCREAGAFGLKRSAGTSAFARLPPHPNVASVHFDAVLEIP